MARSNPGRADLVSGGAESCLLLAAVARTTLFVSEVLINSGGSQLIVLMETTAIGTASLTVTVSEVHEATGTLTTLLASAAIATDTLTRLRISPHLTGAANAVAKEIVPARFQIAVAVADANPADYQLSYQLVP